MSGSSERLIYARLRTAYFAQFLTWGCWNIALPGYLADRLPGRLIGYICMAMAFGAILAPTLIGPLVDRYFKAERILALLHFFSAIWIALLGGICLLGEMNRTLDFWTVFIPAALTGFCFMPTVALLNTIVFRHIPEISKAPKIFIFGTAGWIAANLTVEIFLGGAVRPYFLFMSGGVGLLMSIYSLTLPTTPPRPIAADRSPRLAGLGAFVLLKRPDFAIFLLCVSMTLVFSGGFYFPSLVKYLLENGYPAPLALSTINQFSELIFMSLLGFCVVKFGLKRVILLGMTAWVIRYFLFSFQGFAFALAGLGMHGPAFAFLYSASYMYGEKIAPVELKAGVQSLIAFLLIGLGPVLGGWIFGWQFDRCRPIVTHTVTVDDSAPQPLPIWLDPAMENTPLRFLDLAKSVKYLFGNKEIFRQPPHLGSFQRSDGTIDPTLLPDRLTLSDRVYTRSELTATFLKIKSFERNNSNRNSIDSDSKTFDSTKNNLSNTEPPILARKEYLRSVGHDWRRFYLLPAIFVLFWAGVFAVFGRNPKRRPNEEN